jgi:hypothetical protein
MDSLLTQEKLNNEGLALLFSLLTVRQKKAIALIGLSQLSWAVHGDPKQLLKKIESLARTLRG